MTIRRRSSRLRWLVLALALASVGMAAPALAAAPSNDDFANAEVIDPNEVGCQRYHFGDRSLAQATAEAGEPAHDDSPAAQSIWFTVTPLTTGTARLEVLGEVRHALRVAVYQGGALPSLISLGSMSVAAGSPEGFEFAVQSGERVSIAIDTGGSAAARVNVVGLSLPSDPHTNLTFDSAREIHGERGITPACSGDGDGQVTWYRWTAPSSGLMAFGIGKGEGVYVYRGTSESTLTLLAREFGEQSALSRVYADFWAEQGTTYHVRVTTGAPSAFEVLTWRPGTDEPKPRADFDADGCEDMVVGAPGESLVGERNAGAVVVRYGCGSTVQRWHQGNDGTPSTHDAGDRFGQAVAAGDFDHDGYADLAVGVPREDIGGRSDAGTVIILRGSASGLTSAGATRVAQSAASGPLARNEAGDRFGWALASRDREVATLVVGDNDGDGQFVEAHQPRVVGPADLLIGAPGEDHDGKRDAGILARYNLGVVTAVITQRHIVASHHQPREKALFASSIATGNRQDFRVPAAGAPGTPVEGKDEAGRIVYVDGAIKDLHLGHIRLTPHAGDRLGSAIAVVDSADGTEAIAVGVPGRDVGGARDAGMVAMFNNRYEKYTVLTQALSSVPGSPGAGDRFGASLAAGFLDGDVYEELIIGVPGENVGGDNDAGAVTLLYGGDWRAQGSGTRTLLHRDSNGMAGDTRPGDRFGTTVGAVDLDGDTVDEIVVGAPYDNLSGADNAGSVVLRRRNGTSTLFSATLTPGGAEDGDHFGAAVLQ